MVVRVALLFAFTGLFGTLWSLDQAPKSRTSLATKRDVQNQQSIIGNTLGSSRQSQVVLHQENTTDILLSDLDVPESISPGVYRVVDERGRTGWITVSPSSRNTSARVSEDENLVVTSDSSRGRQYFIRIESTRLTTKAPEGSPVLR